MHAPVVLGIQRLKRSTSRVRWWKNISMGGMSEEDELPPYESAPPQKWLRLLAPPRPQAAAAWHHCAYTSHPTMYGISVHMLDSAPM